MTDSTFTKVGQSENRMFGEPGLLVCGFTLPEKQLLVRVLKYCELDGRPLICPTGEQTGLTLVQALNLPDRSGFDAESGLPRAVIMSGFTEKELQSLMAAYRMAELPRPLWAALTPVSAGWSLAELLRELAAEAEAMKNRKT